MKVADAYIDTLASTINTVIAYVNASPNAVTAQAELLADSLVHDKLGGEFRVSSSGRTHWKGTTLAGAVTACETLVTAKPRRIWHINESGVRRLVLLHD